MAHEMHFHRGRLLDHVHIRVADLERSRAFYRAVLEVFGIELQFDTEHAFTADELFVSADGEPTRGIHIAFAARDGAMVDRFHEVALAAGGTDNGAPGVRDYHPNYYAAYVRDPDGNNIEAVHHGHATRSAESVVLTATVD